MSERSGGGRQWNRATSDPTWPPLHSVQRVTRGVCVCVCDWQRLANPRAPPFITLTSDEAEPLRANDVVITSHHASLQARARKEVRCRGVGGARCEVSSIHTFCDARGSSFREKKGKKKEKVRRPCSRTCGRQRAALADDVAMLPLLCFAVFFLFLCSPLPLINVESFASARRWRRMRSQLKNRKISKRAFQGFSFIIYERICCW